MLVVTKSKGRGRGVFTLSPIEKGIVAEVSPMLVLTDREGAGKVLKKYVWDFGGKTGLAFGFGSLFNHSYDPNLRVRRDTKKLVIVFTANRFIKMHEELTVDYGYIPEGYDNR